MHAHSRRNGPQTEKDGKVSARPATPNRETAAKGEKGEKVNTIIINTTAKMSTFHGCNTYFQLLGNSQYYKL